MKLLPTFDYHPRGSKHIYRFFQWFRFLILRSKINHHYLKVLFLALNCFVSNKKFNQKDINLAQDYFPYWSLSLFLLKSILQRKTDY